MSASEKDSSSDTEDLADEDEGELEENEIVLWHIKIIVAAGFNRGNTAGENWPPPHTHL